jgi:acetyl esterase/lipase
MSDDVLSRPAPPPDLELPYGPLPEHVVDVRLPQAPGPRPLVVVVHGGFWKTQYDRSHAGAQSTALAAAGYVVATVEYRRLGQPGGGWPGTLDDAALFADTVPSLVADAVPGRVDGSPPCFVGHSAGGHLAAWVVSRHRLAEGSRWHRPGPLAAVVVALAGVLDLELSDRLALGGHAARALLEGTPADRPERYAEASPARLLPSGARTVLVHGASDDVVPPEVSRGYAAAARAAGDEVTVHELAGIGHFELIDPLTSAWPTVLSAVAEALTERGTPP